MENLRRVGKQRYFHCGNCGSTLFKIRIDGTVVCRAAKKCGLEIGKINRQILILKDHRRQSRNSRLNRKKIIENPKTFDGVKPKRRKGRVTPQNL